MYLGVAIVPVQKVACQDFLVIYSLLRFVNLQPHCTGSGFGTGTGIYY
jgi:hypothetical protein